MIDPKAVRLYIPSGLGNYKTGLFDRVAKTVGGTIRHDLAALRDCPDDLIPAVGCTVALRPLIETWKATGRTWIYWDRGYLVRRFGTWLPKSSDGGYYRWELNAFQMKAVRGVSDERWRKLKLQYPEWKKPPGDRGHVLICAGSLDYDQFHGIVGWLDRTLVSLRKITARRIVVRLRNADYPLQRDLDGAHIVVTHGSVAAIEALMLGVPVCVDPSSAAAPVGVIDLSDIETPARPDIRAWLHALACSQFHEDELRDGTAWKFVG